MLAYEDAYSMDFHPQTLCGFCGEVYFTRPRLTSSPHLFSYFLEDIKLQLSSGELGSVAIEPLVSLLFRDFQVEVAS